MGFSVAVGDVLMILDADMTVLPKDLKRFYDAIVSGKGDFINGVRLVYPMEDKAMGFLILLGINFSPSLLVGFWANQYGTLFVVQK